MDNDIEKQKNSDVDRGLLEGFSKDVLPGWDSIEWVSEILFSNDLMLTVHVIYSNPPFKELHTQFTKVPLNHLFEQQWVRYLRKC